MNGEGGSSGKMKLKHLEEALQPVKGFTNPVVELEQYITSPHLASHMIHAAAQAGGKKTIFSLHVYDSACTFSLYLQISKGFGLATSDVVRVCYPSRLDFSIVVIVWGSMFMQVCRCLSCTLTICLYIHSLVHCIRCLEYREGKHYIQ